MQSTGQTSTHAWSTQSRQRLVITQGIVSPYDSVLRRAGPPPARALVISGGGQAGNRFRANLDHSVDDRTLAGHPARRRRRHAMVSETTKQRIEQLIGSDRVVVFMKGSRRMPQCGFSAQVVQILDAHVPSYTTVDVLQDPEIRQGIKEFTNWPTVPQVYVAGEFVGGCDIVTEMYQNGELEGLLRASGS